MRVQFLALPLQDKASGSSRGTRLLQHPGFAWMGLRPVFAQHTRAEHAALKRWAAGRSVLVEIGVAEGTSAVALREAMASGGTLYLIDPFHLSRYRKLNMMKRVAQRLVANCTNGQTVWIERLSFEVANDWTRPVDFLFLDGDHSEQGVRRDWEDWNRFVVPGGVVLFHDARRFRNGWPTGDDGPVKLVDVLFRSRSLPKWKIVDEIDSLVVVERLT